MKLNDVKAGMYGKLRDGSSTSILDDSYGVVVLDEKYFIIQLSLTYNEDLTNRFDKNRDITELWYGHKLVFERKDEKTPVDWKPKYGEWYYSVSNVGNICQTKWENDYIDDKVFNLSRVFKSKVEAEKHLEWLKAKRSIELEIARLNEGWTPDWNDDDEEKWVSILNTKTKEIMATIYYANKKHPSSLYLKTRELAVKLLDTHKEELITYFQG